MTWLLFLLLSALCLAPLGLSLWRPAIPRGRHEADLALYRAQRAELDQQLAEGRLEPGTHANAVLEVQRRILAAPQEAPVRAGRGGAALATALLLVPAAALGVYLWHGSPGLPSATLGERREAAAQEEALIAQLRGRIESLDPASPAAWRGWLLLGNAERSRGRPEAALAAWGRALSGRFDPALAADMAELELEQGRAAPAEALLRRALDAQPGEPRLLFLLGLAMQRQDRPEEARRLWQGLLEATPPGAPWRGMVEEQLRGLP
ncbi:c-type cytochrome biogenesis protein CcmI [Roseomonas sp. OT10]|uniref:c-type cytochrome biogenesis protein CcmI n=1 Tax=Roseomonas cutis TaxID=2897332 RepID=UPI001E5240E1|nr:c-type cytochrome biogenesis protein CcmI [Roseomonas sp. OT10]UFN48069.1 c-type cytochrome biogenesis protein CcmI [Roseomonas sp. OT10]